MSRRLPLTLLASLVAVFACGNRDTVAAQVPTSPRATEAIRRVRPDLEKRLERKGLRFGSPVFIQIFKESGELELWVANGERYALFKTYPVCAFSGDLGPKLEEGDRQAPEGFYRVFPGQMNPTSSYHLSFNLGYPNAYDRAHGRTGSALMVHGRCVSIGCFAMTDPGIEEIYALADAALRAGQPYFRVNIYPFRPSRDALEEHADSEWTEFWESLWKGFEYFERHRVPARVIVKDGRYVVAGP